MRQVREDLRLETEKLTRTWAQHDPAWLRDYLVAGVEDPRLNLQSILSRHFLVRALFEDAPWDLMRQEYRFAAVLSWLSGTSELMTDAEARAAALNALRRGSDNSEGLVIPPFVSQAFKELASKANGGQVENYLETFLAEGPEIEETRTELLDTFARIWRQRLPQLNAKSAPIQNSSNEPRDEGQARDNRPSLLEPACGSANDFRFLDRYGIASFLNYAGFDLCEENVKNARCLFPTVQFFQGNVFAIPAPDKSYDFCVVHDLFEHLSSDGIEQAVVEICRVIRVGICIGFFQMAEIREHVIRPIDEYHWNLLSVAQMKGLFASNGFAAQVIHIDSFLYEHTGTPGTHNPDAYTFILWPT